MERTDLELVQAFQRGDRTAADELVGRHLPRVRQLMFQMVLNPHSADDLTQEAFAKAWRGLASFRGQASFATWIQRIALNVAYDDLRRAGRDKACELADEPVDRANSTPDSTVIAIERNAQITVALRRLTPALRSAIVLTVMQGLSAVAAAEIEECSAGTMYWRIHEARRRLRDELKDLIE